MNRCAAFSIGGMLALTVVTTHADTPPAISPAKTVAAAGMVDIRTLVPGIAENIRYAGSDNFTGAPVPGYRAAKCFLPKPAAGAIRRLCPSTTDQSHWISSCHPWRSRLQSCKRSPLSRE